MNKIPTFFVRGPDWKVIDKVMPGCEWVRAGDGVATEKLHGTNVMVVFHQDGTYTIHKRRSPNKAEKKLDMQPINIPVDEDDKGDGYLIDAVERFLEEFPSPGLYGAVYGEVVGKKIQTNQYGLDHRIWHPFDPRYIPVLGSVPRDYEGLKAFMAAEPQSTAYPDALMEGIVFHNWYASAKIKVKDFW